MEFPGSCFSLTPTKVLQPLGTEADGRSVSVSASVSLPFQINLYKLNYYSQLKQMNTESVHLHKEEKDEESENKERNKLFAY